MIQECLCIVEDLALRTIDELGDRIENFLLHIKKLVCSVFQVLQIPPIRLADGRLKYSKRIGYLLMKWIALTAKLQMLGHRIKIPESAARSLTCRLSVIR